MRTPRTAQNYPDLRKVLLTPDPGMWSTVEQHANEVLRMDPNNQRCKDIAEFAKKIGEKTAQPLN